MSYARFPLTGGGGGIPEAPNDGRKYSRIVTDGIGAWVYQPEEQTPYVATLAENATSFDLPKAPVVISLIMLLHEDQSGLKIMQTSDYSYSGTTVTFTSYVAAANDIVRVNYTA